MTDPDRLTEDVVKRLTEWAIDGERSWATEGERQHSADLRQTLAALRSTPEAGEHNCGVDVLDADYRGFQAVCWTCGWRGPERLRGDEDLGTDESRAHKLNAKGDAERHRVATRTSEVAPQAESTRVDPKIVSKLRAWCENAEHDDANVLLDCPALAAHIEHVLAALVPARVETSEGRDHQVRGAGSSERTSQAAAGDKNQARPAAVDYETGPPSESPWIRAYRRARLGSKDPAVMSQQPGLIDLADELEVQANEAAIYDPGWSSGMSDAAQLARDYAEREPAARVDVLEAAFRRAEELAFSAGSMLGASGDKIVREGLEQDLERFYEARAAVLSTLEGGE